MLPESPEQEGISERETLGREGWQPLILRMNGIEEFFRRECRDTVQQDTCGHHEPGEGAGYTDVEQHLVPGQRGANSDDRTHRSEGIHQEVGDRDEEGQRGIHPMIFRGEIVAEFMGGQNRENTQ